MKNEVNKHLVVLSTIIFILSSCSPGQKVMKDYYGSLVQNNANEARKYISDSCMEKLRRASSAQTDEDVLRGSLFEGIESWEIGKAQRIKDTIFVAATFSLSDGRKLIFDKDQEVVFANGTIIEDFRYRLYKEGRQWKINLPYCRNTK